MSKFTYPFCYAPDNEIVKASENLIKKIEDSDELRTIFEEGKMLGVLKASDPGGNQCYLYAFSGLAGGRSTIEGFVPPIYDSSTLRNAVSADDSRALQEDLFNHYIVMNARGETASILDIFAQRGLVPPGGTGECAAPKLLNYAFRHGYTPLAMGEFWYGDAPKSGEVRQTGRFYPACTGKCGPLLGWMMQGLDVEDNPLETKVDAGSIRIIHCDEAIIAASKPSGMLCVPGLTGERSLQEILEDTYGKLYSCHRLDMDTSGVIVFARTPEAQANIQQQFEHRETSKTYIAELCPGTRPWRGKKEGTIALPLSADYYDRPRQMVDREHGKQAITRYELLQIFPDGSVEVRFTPLTGRTHQLRVHAASPLGLGRPIKGDRLYGAPDGGPLRLHAESLTIKHPTTGELVTFRA